MEKVVQFKKIVNKSESHEEVEMTVDGFLINNAVNFVAQS